MLPPGTQIRHVDHPEVAETFVDALGTSMFDGNTLRIELCVQRLDPPDPKRPPSATQHPVCRLVLPPAMVVDLYNQLEQVIAVMEQKGLVTRQDGTPKTIN